MILSLLRCSDTTGDKNSDEKMVADFLVTYFKFDAILVSFSIIIKSTSGPTFLLTWKLSFISLSCSGSYSKSLICNETNTFINQLMNNLLENHFRILQTPLFSSEIQMTHSIFPFPMFMMHSYESWIWFMKKWTWNILVQVFFLYFASLYISLFQDGWFVSALGNWPRCTETNWRHF